MNEKKRLCYCGCGKEFIPMTSWQKFYPGHRDKYWNKIKKARQIAACNNIEPSGVISTDYTH